MTSRRLGRQTVALLRPPSVVSYANVGGKFEANGPLAGHFDLLCTDSFFGKDTWEQAESAMQQEALTRALEKGGLTPGDVDYVLAGDLLNQCIGTAFGLRDFQIPFFGLYGACSTMGESLALGSLLISGGHARTAACMTSSHYCTAERQYRMPVPYGSQRTPTAQWTATAAGCCILGDQGDGPYITHVTCGKIVDMGITDVNNMGAAMAPAAYDTLSALFRETKTGPGDYDLIVTGDLGALGHAIVTDLFRRDGVDLSRNYQDCGLLLYDLEKQDMHAGGSGCGCSAAVLNGYLLDGLRRGATPLSTSVTLVVTGAKWSKYLKPRICSISSVNTRSKNRSQFWKPMVQMGMTVQPSLKYSSVTKFSVTLVMAEITRSEPPMTSS